MFNTNSELKAAMPGASLKSINLALGLSAKTRPNTKIDQSKAIALAEYVWSHND